MSACNCNSTGTCAYCKNMFDFYLYCETLEKVQSRISNAHAKFVDKRGDFISPRQTRVAEFKKCAPELCTLFGPEFTAVALAPFILKQFDMSGREIKRALS